MKNASSPPTPTPSPAVFSLDFGKAAKEVDGVTAELRKLYTTLDATDTRRTSKIKPGAEDFTALVLGLARKEGIQINGYALDDIQGALAQAKQLKELRTAATALLQIVNSAILVSAGKAWSGANLYYSLLQRIARTNPELYNALEPGRALHKRRSKSVKQDQMVARAERKAANAALKAAEQAKKTEVVKARVAAANVAAPAPAEPAPAPAVKVADVVAAAPAVEAGSSSNHQ